MTKALTLLLAPVLAFADPAVLNVSVNIHNETGSIIEFKSFDSAKLFASTQVSVQQVAPDTSEYEVILFEAFNKDPMNAGLNIELEGVPMKLMWQANMGFGGPDEFKSHLCGVIKDGRPREGLDYCSIPYVEDETLYIDFYLVQGFDGK